MIDLKKWIEKVSQRLPKDDYTVTTLNASAFDGNGWTCPKTCFVNLYLNPKTNKGGSWYIRDRNSDLVVLLNTNTGGGVSNSFVAIKNHTYYCHYISLDATRYAVVSTPTGGVSSKSVFRRSSV